ncbi:leucine-rich repeat, immunoglobulin-like domain and transmembrane domain-containing protein 3 [Brienomyrus brachyistius]|uniref:leucine-rich repeat, immunoglobulin-like domain and transmembrane domain-containing protein 3 n=1 Tax=Brienomyrus brachyistius TaxID=42636 RepID=UPI0020B39AAE|nr:leucine-rich repeat, immunoglobulin-like domain and transmembrane domain-containing protein 3 [Brienomyrus brachyistius]
MPVLLYLHVFLSFLRVVCSFCPSQCTCTDHNSSDGTKSRSVLCDDPDMSDIPTNIPMDTVKLRVEKTAVRRIPAEAFYYLVDLRYLWVTYNAVALVEPRSFYNLKELHELRLDGNQLSSFPWEALCETPRLRTLDLHNNRLSGVPAEAAPLLVNITYLDLSSNKLSSLSPDLVDIWPPFSGVIRSSHASQKVVLGLQDNPWVCDCRISKLIELSKMTETSVVLLDQLLLCSGPENLAGVLFSRVELDRCHKPTVMTSATKITSPLGSNVLLRCDATGLPTPSLIWTRSNGSTVNSTVVQESPGEGVRWSVISLNGVQYRDAGDYRCKAKNLAGTVEASITLTVAGDTDAPASGGGSAQKSGVEKERQADAVPVTPIATQHTTTSTLTTTLSPPPTKKQPPSLDGQQGSPAKMHRGNLNGMPPQDENSKGNSTRLALQKPSIKNIQVVEENTDSVVLVWKVDVVPGNVPLTVVYSPYEGKVKQTVTTEVGKGKLALEGLKANTMYMACLIVKGGQSRRDQCVSFSTAKEVAEDGTGPTLMIISSFACVLALPMIALLVYKILSLFCKRRRRARENDLSRETYVKFETLSLKPRTATNQATELWRHRQGQESERMLLCSRSSIDSQGTCKSGGCKMEFFC